MWDEDPSELTDGYNQSGDLSITVREVFEKKKLASTEKSDWSILKVSFAVSSRNLSTPVD